MKYEIKCEFCEENFQSGKSNAKYCSDNCRVKHHQWKKKQKETVSQELSIQQQEQNIQRNQLQQQHDGLIQRNYNLAAKAKKVQKGKKYYGNVIRKIGIEIRYTKLQIEEYQEKQKRLQQQIESEKKGLKKLKVQAEKKSIGLEGLKKALKAKRTEEKEIPSIKNTIEELYQKISGMKRKLIRLHANLEMWKDRLDTAKKNFDKYQDNYQNNLLKIEAIINQLNNPNPIGKITLLHKPVLPKRIVEKSTSSNNSIGAGDLQDMHFNTFRLSGQLGAFLGELDFNKTSIALTGDSGAGKTWLSFEIVKLFIAEMGFRIKYFSLEEGVGKLTQDKVTAFGLGNELNLAGTGSLEDVRKAAKEYSMVVVDSFNSLNTKPEEFERLRTDFPNTIFLLIFQKTTSGTIRGGSAIKYNSSATINVIIREGQRIAIMEKGRYGTIGWEYSITQKQVIKTNGLH
jgi:hypothetical protein